MRGQPVDIVITVGSEPVLDPDLGDFACSNVPIGLVLKEAAGSVTPSHYNVISVNFETGLTPAGTNAFIPETTAPATFLSVMSTPTSRVSTRLSPTVFSPYWLRLLRRSGRRGDDDPSPAGDITRTDQDCLLRHSDKLRDTSSSR